MKNTSDFLAVLESAFCREALKKLILSRPTSGEIKKISCRLCAHRGRRLLAMEYSLPGDTVSHKNLAEDEFLPEIEKLLKNYAQANLITTLGDAEWKRSKGGKEIILGGDALKRKLEGASPAFESAIEALDKKKNYILSGNEEFLIKLGVSDKNGRVHDKRQGKFRQINRFLEYIEEIYKELPEEGRITVYDLCCGKSYLSFAVYYYLTEVKSREVYMLGIDLKRDVMDYCNSVASELGFKSMRFITDNIENTPTDVAPDMVISLHACDTATDVVLSHAVRLKAKVILSTPCCHKKLSDIISCEALGFTTAYGKLKGKLCEALTDALRLEYLKAHGYSVSATELTDPDDTPKNTLLRAIKTGGYSQKKYDEYIGYLKFITADNYNEFPLK